MSVPETPPWHLTPGGGLVLLNETARPEIAILVAAMTQARDAVGRRSWAHPQEPTSDEWWADVLADPRARKRERRTDLAVKKAFYRLADERRETILVACSKCDWRAAFARDGLIASHGARGPRPQCQHHPRKQTLRDEIGGPLVCQELSLTDTENSMESTSRRPAPSQAQAACTKVRRRRSAQRLTKMIGTPARATSDSRIQS